MHGVKKGEKVSGSTWAPLGEKEKKRVEKETFVFHTTSFGGNKCLK